AASNEPMQLEVRRIAAGFAPLGSLFNLSPTVDFLVDLGGGAIKGSYAHGSKARTVEVDIKDIELAKVPAFDSVLGVPVLGTLGGEAEVELHPKRPVLTDGRIQLSGRELTVDETTIENRDFGAAAFIDIPSTSFGKLDADLVVEEGGGSPSLVFEEFRFHEGRDVRGEVWGDVSLAQSAAASRADLKMRFQFDDAYVSDNDLSSVLQAKWFRDGKADQWYGFTLKGPMARVDFNGDPSAGAGPKGDDDKSGKGDGPKRPDRDKRRPNRPKPPE
ncbi:MAG: type II secretion system protein GspN, partial [Persicimonas sp.]